jgi:hypothetical protein
MDFISGCHFFLPALTIHGLVHPADLSDCPMDLPSAAPTFSIHMYWNF